MPCPVRIRSRGRQSAIRHPRCEDGLGQNNHRPMFSHGNCCFEKLGGTATFCLNIHVSLNPSVLCLARCSSMPPLQTSGRRASWRGPSGALRASGQNNDVIKLRLMNIINGNEEVDRAISNGKLHALLHVHTRPINVVVFHGSDREHSFSGWFPA